MPKRDENSQQTEHDEVPELDEVVGLPASEPAPPPNLDLFGDGGMDLDSFRDALTLRLDSEIDRIINDLVAELETSLRERAEKHLRERLPEMVATVLAEHAPRR